jgi:hypothetical protein
MAGDKITLTKIKQANRMVIVFYYPPTDYSRQRYPGAGENDEQEPTSSDHPGRRPANGGGGKKPLRSTWRWCFPWLTAEATRCLSSGWTRPSSPAAIFLNKAWSACSLKQGTHEITSAVQPGQSLYGLQLTNQQRIIIFGGGLPVIFNEQVIGAVGVSGGTVEQDQLLAQCALDCFSAL